MACYARYVNRVAGIDTGNQYELRLYKKDGWLKVAIKCSESFSGKSVEKYLEPSWETLCELLLAIKRKQDKSIYQGDIKTEWKQGDKGKSHWTIADCLGSVTYPVTNAVAIGLELIISDVISRGWRAGEAK